MRRDLTATVLLAVISLLGACSDGDGTTDSGPDQTATTSPTTTTTAEPTGPAADVEPLTGGNGVFLASPDGTDLAAAGWVEEEYSVTGTATSYAADGDLPADGTFELREDQHAEYRTRVVVRRPADPADFNGTVVVEWLNVSGGVDASPDFAYLAAELIRGGYAWVGVSAQLIGVEGGPVAVAVDIPDSPAGRGLRNIDPDRYGDLHHPGDAFSYDIFTQVGRAVPELLGDLRPGEVLAAGESQSGFALTTYVNGVQPLAQVFDGFLVHSRGAAAAPLGAPGAGIAIADAIGGAPTRIRTDLDVPVLVLETETDVAGFLNYQAARQPDTDRLRVWEVAGTAHADAFLIGTMAENLGCSQPINDGPHHFVAKAALRALDTWVRTGEAPPAAEPIVTGADGAVSRDADGIATGGIRTPLVDVPVEVLRGDPSPDSSIICSLFGSTTPLPAERLADLYPSSDDYLAAYEASADEVIDAGFVLADDRDALLADADPSLLGG